MHPATVGNVSMNALFAALQKYPEIAVYLTIAVGFWVGNLQFKRFSLGVVTATLIAGLVIGQVHVQIPGVLQSAFFAMFLFSVGFSVGPEFIRALRSDGLPQVFFAIMVCVSGLITALVFGKLLGYNSALTAGLLSGGYTNSTVLGVATDLLGQSAQGDAAKSALVLVPVAYAVTYPFGTAGSAWFLASWVPRLLKLDLPKLSREYERIHGSQTQKGTTAYHTFATRAFRLTNPQLADRSVEEIESHLGHTVYLRHSRLDESASITSLERETRIPLGAAVAVSGTTADLVALSAQLGPEIDDIALVDHPSETLDIIVKSADWVGRSLAELQKDVLRLPAHGLFLTKIMRNDVLQPIQPDFVIAHRDVLTVRGTRHDVAKAAKMLGYADRPDDKSDLGFMSAGIAIGSVIGAFTVHVAGISISLGTSVGAIVAGILCGYVRARMRTFGRIPAPALWVLNNLGLNGFIAVIGLNAASGFVSGLHNYGLTLFLAGVGVTLIPLIVGVVLGKYVFKFHPVIMLGACAGARSTTAALGALQDAAQSNTPAVGYTIGYAVSRLVMALFTIIVVNVF